MSLYITKLIMTVFIKLGNFEVVNITWLYDMKISVIF